MTYLFAAYALIWVLLFGYLVSIHRRQSQLTAQVETLRQYLDARRS